MTSKRLRISLGLVALLVVAVIGLGPWAFAHVVEGNPAAMLSLPPGEQPVATPLDGTWNVVAGPDHPADRTQAGYRAQQKLLWQTIDAAGRTTHVTGIVVITGHTLQSAHIVVDVATITSAHHGRDERFLGKDVMDAATYPTAELTVVSPQQLGVIPDDTTPAHLVVAANLTLKGQTRPVSVDITLRRSRNQIIAVGDTVITFRDFGIDPPQPPAGILQIQPTATIEFLVSLARAQ